MKEFLAFINGEFVDTKRFVEIQSPIDNSIVGKVTALSSEHIDFAYKSASQAFEVWRNLSMEYRSRKISKFRKLLIENKDELAELMNLEIDKPISDSLTEIERTADYIQETIDKYSEIYTKEITIKNKTNHLTRIPLGVVLAISPFNYPVNLAISKIAPALIMGNTVVFKPATNGSLCGAFITKLISKLDLPKGTFNLVSGRGRDIGDLLTSHKMINMISFTGSVNIGKGILENHKGIPIVLELGGNDAAYVRKDADLNFAAEQIAKGAFGFSGQRCTAIKRLLIDAEIQNDFLNLLIEQASKINPCFMVTETAANYVTELIDDSINSGRKIIYGGDRTGNKIQNTIIESNKSDRLWNEEQFGPVLPFVIIDKDDDPVKLINQSNFGLQNSVFTSDIEWATKIAKNIESGSFNINAASSRGPDIFPFLGVKDSGFGTQGIEEALISMSRYINIIINK